MSNSAPSLDYETPVAVREPQSRNRIRNLIIRALVILALFGVSIFAFFEGLRVRQWTWSATAGSHFIGDVENAYDWGNRANQEYLFYLFDNIASGRSRNGPKQLDYPPLRLAAAAAWTKWTSVNFNRFRGYHDDYAFTYPMLQLNVISEFLCSVFVFLLIRMWSIRMDNANRPLDAPPRAFRGVWTGMIGAMLFWFNPAVLYVGHGWPQWDIWLLPFYLAAVLLACVDFWFCAGACLAIGAFFKGQLLFAAPLLLLWPLLRLQFGHVLQLIAGMAMASAAIAFLWIKPNLDAFVWLMLVIVAIALLLPLLLRWKLRWIWIASAAAIAALIAWPWKSDASLEMKFLGPGLIGVIALSRFMPSRLIPHVCAAVIAVCVFLTIPLFHGSTGWYTIGFEAGTKKFMYMTNATAYNVPESLMRYFRWPSNPNALTTLPWTNIQISSRNLMLWLYGICLLLSSIGAAMHSKRPDTRFLVAVCAPWICAFVLLTQINNRYLVWAAGLSALMPAVGLGMTLLGMLVTLICVIGVADIVDNGRAFPVLQQLIAPADPHYVWLLILTAAIYLYVAVLPRRRVQIG